MSTVAALRQALAELPDDAPVIIEDDYGRKYRLLRCYPLGWNTAEPGLVLDIRELPVIDVALHE